MPTPFGTLYSSNITPDAEIGIGKWSTDDFYRTMHNGRFPDGGLIYPAMPFASYTTVTRADSDAIFAYLKTIPPVNQKNRPQDLRFPYDNRQLLLGWRTLFFTEGEYRPDSTRSLTRRSMWYRNSRSRLLSRFPRRHQLSNCFMTRCPRRKSTGPHP